MRQYTRGVLLTRLGIPKLWREDPEVLAARRG